MLPSIFRTVFIYIAVLAAIRLMGKRQLGEMQPAELVTTFLLSNIASICIDEPDLPLLYSLVPIFLIAALEVLNSTVAWYCPRYAAILFGKPVTVLRDGKIDLNAMEQLRITGSDLAEALRGKDIFSPDDVAWGVIESNGSLSAATKEDNIPMMLPIIVDGILYHDNMQALQLDEGWIDRQLRKSKTSQSQALLFLSDGSKQLLITNKKAAPKGGQHKT